jgi:hypothetical protein
MTTLVLFIGIGVTFLTVWGVIMIGSYLWRGADADLPVASPSPDWVAERPVFVERPAFVETEPIA